MRAHDLAADIVVPVDAAGCLALCAIAIDEFVTSARAAVVAVGSMGFVAPPPSRKPRALKPDKPAKPALCPLGKRHRFVDGVCKCGATKGGVAPSGALTVVEGVAKRDPQSRPLHGTEVHLVLAGAIEALCGLPSGAILSANRTDEPGDTTCGDCRELAS